MSTGVSSPASPRRRWFLKGALAIAAVGGGLGGGIWWNRGLEASRLTTEGRQVFEAVARAVLGKMLPTEPAARQAALDRYLTSLEGLINTMPSAKRDQISLLVGVLANAPTRYMVTGMWTSWQNASDEQVSEALQRIAQADNLVQNTAYAALRGLTCMAFFSSPDHWAMVAYPGPVQL